jgi:hypothetical protein
LDETTELRRRNLKDDFLFLAPKYSVLNNDENDFQIDAFYRALCNAKRVDPSLLEALDRLKRASWMGDWY